MTRGMTTPPTPANLPLSDPSSDAPDGATRAERLNGARLRSLIIINLAASVAFTAMYSTQPVLPQIGAEFHVSPAEAGLTLLSVTFALAFASLSAGRLADRYGARRVMLICLAALTLLSVAAPFAPTFAALVALRAAQGLTLPGITVAGLAYLHNELPAAWRGRVSGFYIAANTLGGLIGRLGVGLSVERIGWRGGLGLVAAWVGLGALLLLVTSPARQARQARNVPAVATAPIAPSVSQVIRRLWWAPLIGGTIFFPFLTVFSYAPFRLEGPPFNLSATGASLIYLAYLLGAIASPIAGAVSDRAGRRPTIQLALAICAAGLALSLAPTLAVVALGLALVCVGSLMAHVVANAAVSQSANPLGAQARGTALSLYTLGFYVGGGLGSFLPGFALTRYGWDGVIALCAVALLGAALCSLVTPARPERGPAVAPPPPVG
jgi:YNFM family putative membrane transporter